MIASFTEKVFIAAFQTLLQVGSTLAEVEDGFSPMLFAIVLLMGVTILVLIGVGIVLGGFLIIALLVSLIIGVLSVSMLIGYLDRSITTVFKTLVLLVSALSGIPLGILCLLMLSWFQEGHYSESPLNIIIAGGIAGLMGGLVIGVSSLKLADYLKGILVRKYGTS
jgi:phosphoglycerol transferase MdoB-like AlkP superfamily enzyme